MLPENVFKDRHYDSQAVVTLITANYIVFALAVEICVSCTGVNWFFWVILAGLAFYNYYTIRRNSEEFSEKRIQIVYGASVVGLGIVYYLLGVVGQHCQPPIPVK